MRRQGCRRCLMLPEWKFEAPPVGVDLANPSLTITYKSGIGAIEMHSCFLTGSKVHREPRF